MSAVHDYYPVRRDDPDTSHEAAHEIVDKGHAKRQRTYVANLVREYPWHTAKELDVYFHTDGWFHRRLSEALKRGEVAVGDERPCAITHYTALTWGPPQGPQLVEDVTEWVQEPLL